MTDKFIIGKHQKINNPVFSILLPTWNNLEMLKLCIRSLQSHSTFKHQIIVFINEGKDDTLAWVKSQDELDYIYSPVNIGVCFALNAARTLATSDLLAYFNDDMYALPKWDEALVDEIKQIGHRQFMISATMIEPNGHACTIDANFGQTVQTFDEEKLLQTYQQFTKEDWMGSTWPPNIIPIELWDLVGGLSIEYTPGMTSDPDFSRKLWMVGIRYFKGIGRSRVYHFGSISTKRIKHNKGNRVFLDKWHLTPNFFLSKILRRGTAFSGLTPDFKITRKAKWLNQFKKLYK